MNNPERFIQQTDEWLEFRKNKIGSSDAPVIMGVSPWSTPYKKWLEKLSLTENKKSHAMQRGLDLEDKARECFEEMTGLMVFPQVIEHPENNWMIASLDGITIEKDAFVEIKCPGKEDHNCAMSGKIPDKYYPQLQHQLEVCKLEKGYYFSYSEKSKNTLLEVFRDDKYIKKMVELELEFWDCLQNFIPPKLTEKDFVYKNDDVWSAAAAEWAFVNKNMKGLETREKELREVLISMSNKQNAKGAGIKLVKTIRKGSVDYSSIPQLQDINLDRYRKEPIEYWKIINEGK